LGQRLEFSWESPDLGVGEDGTVEADVGVADVAPAALPHLALHLHLEGGDDLLVGEAKLLGTREVGT